ncbi:MAG: serine acetyltransferase [Deltaproteobacteria bacterium]|nr:MAG: serine acetyltransferase [Deltaproteobacteria bacterium]PIE74997.1 MAG: serine acetyltransferase [Deltaproteobacteria bacterium]
MNKIFPDIKIYDPEQYAYYKYKEKLPDITEKIIDSCFEEDSFTHINNEPIPSRTEIVKILHSLVRILFPGYFSKEKLDPFSLKYKIGLSVSQLFQKISKEIINSFRHEYFKDEKSYDNSINKGYEAAISLFEKIPYIRTLLGTDVRATFDGDPAAKNYEEIIFSYPGIFAITVYRIAHELYKMEIPLIPRIMTEYAHSITGIDIHPGASIGERFAIDHGTGVVIGETTIIGKNVRIYQGVTLGAMSLPKNAGQRYKGKKRHPTIEDDVIIYSGTTVLGGDTIIGKRAVIGGNVWLTESVPPGTMVLMEDPKLIYKHT